MRTTYQYDQIGALTRMGHQGLTKDGAAMSLNTTYQYDALGRRTRIAVDDTSAQGMLDAIMQYYYDPLGRLYWAGQHSGTGDYLFSEEFMCDAVGNRARNRAVTRQTLAPTGAFAACNLILKVS